MPFYSLQDGRVYTIFISFAFCLGMGQHTMPRTTAVLVEMSWIIGHKHRNYIVCALMLSTPVLNQRRMQVNSYILVDNYGAAPNLKICSSSISINFEQFTGSRVKRLMQWKPRQRALLYFHNGMFLLVAVFARINARPSIGMSIWETPPDNPVVRIQRLIHLLWENIMFRTPPQLLSQRYCIYFYISTSSVAINVFCLVACNPGGRIS